MPLWVRPKADSALTFDASSNGAVTIHGKLGAPAQTLLLLSEPHEIFSA